MYGGAYMQYKLFWSPRCPDQHLELIPGIQELKVGGLFCCLEGILYRILLGNVEYRGILPSHAKLALHQLEPFGNQIDGRNPSKSFSQIWPEKSLLVGASWRPKKSLVQQCAAIVVLCWQKNCSNALLVDRKQHLCVGGRSWNEQLCKKGNFEFGYCTIVNKAKS